MKTETLRAFRNGQRIVVVEDGPLKGRIGTVVRLRFADEGAWVNMDRDLPEELVSFHEKSDNRHRHLLLYPDQCVTAPK